MQLYTEYIFNVFIFGIITISVRHNIGDRRIDFKNKTFCLNFCSYVTKCGETVLQYF